MCYQITIACARERVKDLRAATRGYFRLISTSDRPPLPDKWVAFGLTEGGCGCDLYADPLPTDLGAKTERFRAQHRKPKFRKRGWTEARIDAAVEEMRRREKFRPVAGSGIRVDLREAIGRAVVAAGEVALAVYWCTRGIAGEATLSLHAFLHEEVAQLNVLYTIKRDA